ncbi:DinB family protein [Streptomyces sp. SAJ15]|uniref:DinB family protein n=1 Tax=Streptomyces sp. SAJ15 TaxID=2011095 RepID=UPI00118698ED|nr:DinB family protein [Streptomyces sp. SAJ15]TVL89890.1 Mini-circle protein [Streptomyces sp. SAJ15]
MTTTERQVPPLLADERTMLESWLDFHRLTLAAKCEGLDDAQLRETSAPPSELSLLGLVRHMTDVERHWFRRVLDGQDAKPLYWSDADQDGDFHLTEADTVEAGFAAWQAEIAAARTVADGRSLNDVGHGRWRDQECSLRWIYVHMIEEYARHNGHADLLRERIDGSTGA